MRTALLLTALLLVLSLAAKAAPEGAIDESLLNDLKQTYGADDGDRRILNAITNNSIKSLSLNREKVITHDKLFNVKLKPSGIVNQENSGRCWMFAGVNVLAPKLITKLQLSEFEISEPYITFYDKLEKANFFLERMIELRDKPLEDRSIQIELRYLWEDGGWWHYMDDLIKKYGLVPLSAMPETKQSASTGSLNDLGQQLLRGDASELRQMHQAGKPPKALRTRKNQMLQDIYRLLVYTYGQPPEEFVFRYESGKDSTKTIVEKTYTPESFYREMFADEIPEYVALCNNPTKSYDTLYELAQSRNIYERSDYTILNLPIERLKHYAKKALLDSQVVWFACDVGKDNYIDSGVMKLGIYDFNTTFGLDFSLTKAERIAFQDISPNHAMAFTGVDTAADGSARKWLVENSWGSKRGDNGFWYMYDDWFTEYVLVVVIDKQLLAPADLTKFLQKPQKIEDWEPFFLALRNLD